MAEERRFIIDNAIDKAAESAHQYLAAFMRQYPRRVSDAEAAMGDSPEMIAFKAKELFRKV